MSKYIFKSNFSADIEQFIQYKRSLGYPYDSSENLLARFDCHCAEQFPNETIITREIAMSWTEIAKDLSPNTRIRRTSPVRGLAKYMVRHGKDAYVIPYGEIAHEVEYVPYIYTDSELCKLFSAADKLVTKSPLASGQWLFFPCALRLLYATGMRQGEARLLQVNDVDLSSRAIHVGPSKSLNGRTVYVSDEVVEHMVKYDESMRRLSPGRNYFFSTLKGSSMAKTWLRNWFEAAKCIAGIDEPGVVKRIHDLRHTFCVHRLNAWVKEGKDIRAMLPYLSAYVGHKDISSTDYYLHLVPEFFPDYSELVSHRQDIIPQIEVI